MDRQDRAVAAAHDSLRTTTTQYKAGTVSYLDVVTVQTTALSNERAAVDLLGRRMVASVLLVQALGGGWNVDDLPSTGACIGPRDDAVSLTPCWIVRPVSAMRCRSRMAHGRVRIR
jgi:hypothetical protein